jgi:hypothetical protein
LFDLRHQFSYSYMLMWSIHKQLTL